MVRGRLTDNHAKLLKNHGFQVVFHGDPKLRRKIYDCDTFEDATELVELRKKESQKRKPRRNFYIIWFRKGIWNSVVLETGILKKCW